MTPFDPHLLNLFPYHRKLEKRTATLTLDELVDDYREIKTMSASEFDFLLMAYRYEHVFQKFWQSFTKQKLKPPAIIDLLRLAFGALVTRREENLAPLTHALVETAKSIFGEHTASLVNAFCRQVLRDRPQIVEVLRDHPEEILGPALRARWRSELDLQKRFATKIAERPESGIWCLKKMPDGTLSAGVIVPKEFSQGETLAVSAGSFRLTEWMEEKITHLFGNHHHHPGPAVISLLDMCAAPGGKLIALLELFKVHEKVRIQVGPVVAVEAKFKRAERLKKNLQQWKFVDKVEVILHDWTGKAANTSPIAHEKKWDVILADLPCTGLGTLATRPDILQEDWQESDTALFKLQENIIREGLKRAGSKSLFFVSVCSSDPSEIGHLSRLLGCPPAFKAQLSTENSEELTGWLVQK